MCLDNFWPASLQLKNSKFMGIIQGIMSTTPIQEQSTKKLPWVKDNTLATLELLEHAHRTRRAVVLLTGAGMSIDAGIPVASQLSQYLIQVAQFVQEKNFSSVRRYIEETRWPSRHDLRVDLMLELGKSSLTSTMNMSERVFAQDALVTELRRSSPTMAYSLEEIFKIERDPKGDELERLKRYDALRPLAKLLASRSPNNVSYRSLLFHLCENEQTLIDSCFDHFIRDRMPTTTHQFLVFVSRLLSCKVILSTNFDPLLERSFANEGIAPTVFEIQGEGTIPSNHLLLSQPMSIVKLHGGPHHKRTGFDLDEPLSSAALSSFRGLFEGLREGGESPLLIVMGYSGSDRRVMDIVAGHIAVWKYQDRMPCVLWANRGPNPPQLLQRAVETNPAILYGTQPNSEHRESEWKSTPAHYVKYSDGRLLLSEIYQRIAGRFPVARSHYQAINFVPHPMVNDSDRVEFKKKLEASPRVDIITENTESGSSSRLAALVSVAESSGYTSVQIDLSEIGSVSALLDVLTERLCKFDYRLQPMRRPQLLHNMLRHIQDATVNDPKSERQNHEIDNIVRWIQHALRRGKYLLALDSADEFPSFHPALECYVPSGKDDKDDVGTSNARDYERGLLVQIISRLHGQEDFLGDSRIAVALTINEPTCLFEIPRRQFLEAWTKKDELSQRKEEEGPAKNKEENVSQNVLGEIWRKLFDTGWSDFLAEAKKAKEDVPAVEPSGVDLAILLATAVASRRIRSESMLLWTAGSVIELLQEKVREVESITVDQIIRENWLNTLWENVNKDGMQLSKGSFYNGAILKRLLKLISYMTRTDECWNKSVVGAAAGEIGGVVGTTVSNHQWIYRVEGGYHWMHYSLRDILYRKLRKEWPHIIGLLHHRIALFNHDELYDRSRDPRAFLEYLYHRTAALHVACEQNQFAFALHWFRRIVVSIMREKSVLMARVRFPSLIDHLFILQRTVGKKLWVGLSQEARGGSRSKIADKPIELCYLMSNIWSVIADFLLAGGHPHSAVRCEIARLKQLMNLHALEESPPARLDWAQNQDVIRAALDLVNANTVENSEHQIRIIKALSDLANCAQDPFLTTELKYPIADDDWVWSLYSGADHNPAQVLNSKFRGERIEQIGKIYTDLNQWMRNELKIENRQRTHTNSTTASAGKAGKGKKVSNIIFASDTQEQTVDEVASGLLKRYLEYQNLKHSRCFTADVAQFYRFISNNLYTEGLLKGSSGFDVEIPNAHTQRIEHWIMNYPSPQSVTPDDGAYFFDEKHLLRLTRRRRRHECYRLCMQARRMACHEAQDNWPRIEALFSEAEAVLNRQGEPPDQQALAITRLLHASQALRWAELELWRGTKVLFETYLAKLGNDDAESGRFKGMITQRFTMSELKKLEDEYRIPAGNCIRTQEIRQRHSMAKALLTMAAPLLDEGRGENRWRFFYLLTQTRFRMMSAVLIPLDQNAKALFELEWAGSYLGTAITNCGKLTDRYRALILWWQAFKPYMARTVPAERAAENWRRYKSRLGIEWNPNWRGTRI
ncbi:hypothetical protein IT570_02585 [Candidatus Sumerlaeota bacterium]|nr:hypothetical protein [Candidatus Sumerlaeota bacterium]